LSFAIDSWTGMAAREPVADRRSKAFALAQAGLPPVEKLG
jgi:hypothetical protein